MKNFLGGTDLADLYALRENMNADGSFFLSDVEEHQNLCQLIKKLGERKVLHILSEYGRLVLLDREERSGII